MRKTRHLLLALAVVLCVTANAHAQSPAEVSAKADATGGSGRTGDAMIYFYRTSSFTDSFLNPTLYAGQRRLARLEKDRFFALPVPAGTYYFSWTDDPDPDEQAWVTVSRGELAFFKVRYRSIQPVDAASAIVEMRNLQPVEAGNVYDPEVTAPPVIE